LNSNLAGLPQIYRPYHRPDEWFRDLNSGETLKNIDNYELAFYGYRGYWKSPGGQNAARPEAIFPDLNVYGASLRGAAGKGIGNAEVGYYESADDAGGGNFLINNSEMRYLVGYTREIAKDFTMGLQYYIEQMLDYGSYKRNLPSGPARDEDRHLTSVRLTRLLMNQNLRLAVYVLFAH
jgi:hypothetical protein